MLGTSSPIVSTPFDSFEVRQAVHGHWLSYRRKSDVRMLFTGGPISVFTDGRRLLAAHAVLFQVFGYLMMMPSGNQQASGTHSRQSHNRH
jgi:hypothetical protein